MKLILTSLVFIFNAVLLDAAEVDNFSYANLNVPDITDRTNLLIDRYLKKIVNITKSCERDEVLQNTLMLLDTNFPEPSRAVSLSINSNPKAAIYTDFNYPSYSGCCENVVKLANSKVGIDKIDHFFSSGFLYFLDYSERKNKKIISLAADRIRIYKSVPRVASEEEKNTRAIDIGKFQEESSWGLAGTGVKSYGDLAANYKGFLFYKELLDGENPYLKCIEGKFKVVRAFHIEDYVDDAWDESINCSSFNSQENRDIVYKNMKKLGFEKCPIDAKKCEDLVKKYGEEGRIFLHPNCLNPKEIHTQVESPNSNYLRTIKFIQIRDIKQMLNGAK